ncbi:unnamed protein product [Rhizophagus irregularis]|nr:unnamed protein product [Rhizophagus irregularis]
MTSFLSKLFTDARCLYFKSALSNDWCKKDENRNIIFKKPNILPNVFEVILNYVYTGTLVFSNLTTSEIIHLLETIDELAFEELFSHVQEHLISHSSEFIKQNISTVTDIAFKHEAFKILQTYCIDLITKEPQPFFSSPAFLSTNESILIAILSSDDVRIEEIILWNYIIQWGLHNSSTPIEMIIKDDEIEYETIDEYTSIDFTSLKTTLSPLLSLIRFSDISTEDYETKVKPFQSILPSNLLLWRYHFEDKTIKINLTSRKPPYSINSTLINHKQSTIIANWIDSNEESNYILSRIQPNLKYYAIYDGENFGPSFGKGDMEFSCISRPREGFCRWRCYDKPIRDTEARFWIEEIEVFKVIQ